MSPIVQPELIILPLDSLSHKPFAVGRKSPTLIASQVLDSKSEAHNFFLLLTFILANVKIQKQNFTDDSISANRHQETITTLKLYPNFSSCWGSFSSFSGKFWSKVDGLMR